MSTIAIVMMIVALLAVWGGLGLALLNLKRHPEEDDGEAAVPAGTGTSSGGPVDESPDGSAEGRHRRES
ncbi:MAG TPA: methionine/alanine import family NSS transporter small subunit [Arthrobacter sp.]|nr:methionine/alanine import family NSS transporter small subunit [Arthrobacter sp.]